LIEERLDLEQALEEARDAVFQFGGHIALHYLFATGTIKTGATAFRKLGGLGMINLGRVAQANGRAAELLIGTKYIMNRNVTQKIGRHLPDFISSKVIREIKNVQRLDWSKYSGQLAAFANEAVNSGRKFYIHVRPGTRVSQSTIDELDNIFGTGSRRRLWDIIADIPDSLRVVP
jgi:hypothetical protein